MPHIRFRALPVETVNHISKNALSELAIMMDCPQEDITFEYIHSSFFYDGERTDAYPFVEVLWFFRGQAVQDEVAKYLTQQVRNALMLEDVAIVFLPLTPSNYYDNGNHYG